MSLILSGTDGVSDIDGTAATPAIRGTDANTGIFFGSDIIGFSEGGAECARFNADAQFVAAAGTALLPVITTTGDTNTGIFFPAADTIAFTEGGVESMRITDAGRLGIGTNNPTATLEVLGGGSDGFQPFAVNSTSAELYTTYRYSSSTLLGYIGNGSGTISGASNLFVMRSQNDLAFAAGGATERMRIDSSGNLLVGTTTAYAPITATVASTGAMLSLDRTSNIDGTLRDMVQFRRSVTSVGSITCSNTATAYNTSSDYRLKENIVPMTGALGLVQQLKPVTYNWKVDGSSSQGFIAHELQAVVPYAVSGEKDGEQMQGVDYGKITPLLTAALQEALAKIESLEARLAVLESK